jgi:hypothetical protein
MKSPLTADRLYILLIYCYTLRSNSTGLPVRRRSTAPAAIAAASGPWHAGLRQRAATNRQINFLLINYIVKSKSGDSRILI